MLNMSEPPVVIVGDFDSAGSLSFALFDSIEAIRVKMLMH
jgi:thiamine pyrophosphokinase